MIDMVPSLNDMLDRPIKKNATAAASRPLVSSLRRLPLPVVTKSESESDIYWMDSSASSRSTVNSLDSSAHLRVPAVQSRLSPSRARPSSPEVDELDVVHHAGASRRSASYELDVTQHTRSRRSYCNDLDVTHHTVSRRSFTNDLDVTQHDSRRSLKNEMDVTHSRHLRHITRTRLPYVPIL